MTHTRMQMFLAEKFAQQEKKNYILGMQPSNSIISGQLSYLLVSLSFFKC